MKMKSLLQNGKTSLKVPAEKIKFLNSSSKSVNPVRSAFDSNGFKKTQFNAVGNEIVIRDIPLVSKTLISNKKGANFAVMTNREEINDKKAPIDKLKEIQFKDNDLSDDDLLTSVSFRKDDKSSVLRLNVTRKKKTKKEMLEDKMLEVDDNEIRSIVRDIENKIDQEIEEEIKHEESLKENPDEKRANIILEKDKLIKKAYDNGLVSKDELMMFIDYYEILADINKKKSSVIEILESISKECPLVKEKDHWDQLRKNIEENFETTLNDAALGYALHNKADISVSNISHNEKPTENENREAKEEVIITQKLGNKMISFKNKYNNATYQDNSLRSSQSSMRSSQVKQKVPKNFDLHEDIKLNHLPGNQAAKKLAIAKDYKSKNSSLYNFKAKIKDDDEDLKNKFIDLLEMPQKMINEMKIPDNRKSYVKSKIFDALNYVKEKKFQLKGK